MAENGNGLRGFLNQKGAAHYLGLHVQNFRNIFNKAKRKVPHYKISGRYFFKKEDLDLWLEGFRKT